MDILTPLLLGIMCIGAVFLAAAGVGVLLYINQTRSRKNVVIPPNWSAITGRITATKVEETADDEDDFYYPSIEYEYTVEGQVYTGKQAVGKPYNFTAKAKQILAHYPVGSEIAVYYNPEKPAETRLAGK
jgi:hypothetical protein